MTSEPLDLADVIADIRRIAEADTASGKYDEGFEDGLRSHFARLLDRDDGRDRFDSLHASIARLAPAAEFSRGRIEHASSVPGGEVLHRAVGKAVSRQVNGLVGQLNEFTNHLMPMLHQLADMAVDPMAHVHGDVLHELDTVQDRLARTERIAARLDGIVRQLEIAVPAVLHHASQLEGLSARIDAIEERERRRRYDPPFSSVAFGDASRGDEAAILAEYRPLADSLVGVPGTVLDIGAGRGEFLQLLADRGVAARGVEIDEELVGLARSAGHHVVLADGLDALREEPPGVLGAVVLLHVIEHLHPNELLELLALARDRLAVGGKLVLETPNPQSLYVYARAFWLDPTHTKPVHPKYLQFALEQAGFKNLHYEWTALPSADERLIDLPERDGGTEANENVRRLNDLLFAPQNYRVTATR